MPRTRPGLAQVCSTDIASTVVHYPDRIKYRACVLLCGQCQVSKNHYTSLFEPFYTCSSDCDSPAKMIRGLHCVFFVAFVATHVQEADATPVTVTCPEKLEHGVAAVITCAINTVELDAAGCGANPTTVTFQKTPKGLTSKSVCPTSYTTSNCVASNADANGTCGCTELSGDIKTFKYRFVADKDEDEGAEYSCSVCAAIPPIVPEQKNCKSLTFVGSDDNGGLSPGAIVGIVIGALAGVGLLVGIGVFAAKKLM